MAGVGWGWRWGSVASTLNKLSAVAVKNLAEPGRHSDGGGLYLVVGEPRDDRPSSKTWVFMWKVAKKRREMGLGVLRDVPLAAARDKAAAARLLVAEGKDPIEERDRVLVPPAAPSIPTFGELADATIVALRGGWRGKKTEAGWKRSLAVHAAGLRPLAAEAITVDDVIAALNTIWFTRPDSAGDLRERIEKVLDAARARKLITGPWENPARWRGNLEHLMPKRPTLTRGHHRALHYSLMPAFMAQLRAQTSMSAKALEFTILTIARETMTLEATRREVRGALWTIPPERMKEPENGEHRVPLSARAVEILDSIKPPDPKPDEVIFMNQRGTGAMSNASMDRVLQRMKVDATPHGFRSTFRDWAGDCTNYPRELAEEALAHAVGDAQERAYRRGDALKKRKAMMDDWAAFCAMPPPDGRKDAEPPARVS